MPLKKGASQATFDYNLKKLLDEGWEKKRALAACYDQQERARAAADKRKKK